MRARDLIALCIALLLPPAGVATASPQVSEIPGLEDRTGENPLAAVFEKADPDADPAWRSEQVGKEVGVQLKTLAKAFETADWSALPAVKGARSNLLVPEQGIVYADDSTSVSRGTGEGAATDADLVAQLKRLRAMYSREGDIRVKFKVVEIGQPDEDGSTGAKALLEIVGDAAAGGRMNHSAVWDLEWKISADGAAPLHLRTLVSSQFEEVRANSPLFSDATSGLLGDVPSFRDQLVYGADHWYGNLDVSFGIHQGNQGLALGDADGDGHDDLFVCQPAGLPSRLYLRKDDGRLRDATVEAGLDFLDTSRSALFVDLDADGDQDLLVTLGYSLVVLENDGKAKFSRRVVIDIHSWPASICATDYDLDGDLDIYACGYNPRGETAPGDIFANPVPYHDANNGARNFFIRNLGGLQFEDATVAVGLSENNRRFSFAASWEDYDNDGDPDLYVANDFGRNNLYRNDLAKDGTRRFIDVSESAGVEDIAAGMSVSWGDYDRDGLPDLYTSNMFSAAGQRVTSQKEFKPGIDGRMRSDLRRHARGNTLYRNLGDGTFQDVSEEMGVTLGRWAWGSRFADFNNDGNDDLYVANGFFSTADSGDL